MKKLCTNKVEASSGKIWTNITDAESVSGIVGVGTIMGIEDDFYLINHEPSTTGSSISLSVLACFLNASPSLIYSGCITEEGETDEMDSDVVMVKLGAIKKSARQMILAASNIELNIKSKLLIKQMGSTLISSVDDLILLS